jgi:hypothetical protein
MNYLENIDYSEADTDGNYDLGLIFVSTPNFGNSQTHRLEKDDALVQRRY